MGSPVCIASWNALIRVEQFASSSYRALGVPGTILVGAHRVGAAAHVVGTLSQHRFGFLSCRNPKRTPPHRRHALESCIVWRCRSKREHRWLQRTSKGKSKFVRTSNDRHACRCGLLESPSVCLRSRESLRWSARSPPRTPIFQTRARMRRIRKRNSPQRGLRSTAETECGVPSAVSSNRYGRSRAPMKPRSAFATDQRQSSTR